ncbi:hypothetical protein [Roseicella aerolata]|uniref:DUF4384 domain-containing protein n=1 Tax=Roseicella aerolata TaxID=2883479 RepID=A0A9X1IBT3_9PROT|nr:hypothetical protein [Roseicella aerolata]MCB4820160.1 hypothetical protein [Roseicella aerolata]
MLPRSLPAIIAALLLGCAAGQAARAAEGAVLLSATAPGYAPGMVLAPGERLRLPDGASMTLLLRSGEMLRLRGPLETRFDPTLPGGQEGSAAALAGAFRLRGLDASAIGGTRATLGRRSPPPADIAVETDRSGTWCLRPADTVWLLRPAAERTEIALRRRGSLRRLAWPAGAARIEWPGDLTIEDGDAFEVMAEGQARGEIRGEIRGQVLATLTFRVLATPAPSEAAALAQGLLLGCREQHEAALRRLARASLPPELWLSTERGRSPVYAPAEAIGLVAMAGQDGWLYCVSARSDGGVVAVFPAGAVGGARLPAAAPASLSAQRQSLALRAGPRGTERVRCWLAERDIGPALPPALLDASGTPLPDGLAEALDGIFEAAGGPRLARAALEIRVE